ncbi:unnamed protein product [Adineta ricciae]|uniref:Uncharacterized protein n=1 Tax=Adineta ricciae TaxID=249248 RepID=A0A815LJ22_ADIRI|nr:unnamed protein product [Adineta ricciae]CAF1403921.1 unnamed protein product [Adineta ricciae]
MKISNIPTSITAHIHILIAGIILVALLCTAEVLKKLVNNGRRLKKSWFKVKSVKEYRRRATQQRNQHIALTNALQ